MLYNVICSKTFYDVLCDVLYNITLTPNPKFQNKK